MRKRLLLVFLSLFAAISFFSAIPDEAFAGPFRLHKGACFRLYDKIWFNAPIPRQNGGYECYNFCDQSVVDSANKAYDDPGTPSEMRKRIDKFTDGSDESEGQGGQVYKSLSECREKEGVLPPPVDDPNGSGASGENVTIAPNKVTIDVPFVTVYFRNIPPREDKNTEYFYCLKTDPKDCDDDDLKSTTKDNATGRGITTGTGSNNSTTITFARLCGDGGNKLKTSCDDDGSDWFHQGEIYRITIFDKKKVASNVITDASFYVSHSYPKVDAPLPGARPDLNMKALTAPGTEGSITVTLSRPNALKNKDVTYFTQLQGRDSDYNSPGTCLKVPANGTTTDKIRLPRTIVEDGQVVETISEGGYVLSIQEAGDKCTPGKFVYYHIPVFIGAGSAAGSIGEKVEDPFQQERSGDIMKRTPPPICADNQKDARGYCTSVPTGLGISIHTEPTVFVRDVFRIVLSIGGIATLVFFIRASYTIMTSAGNKEKVGQAREQITSAITGLIFIILSVVILEFIGIDILQIPGLTR